MTKRLWIYSYNEASEGAKELARSLKIRRIKHENSAYKWSPNNIVINWGSRTVTDELRKSTLLNPPEAIAKCSDKLKFFNLCASVQTEGDKPRIPNYTTDGELAKGWVAGGSVVVARKTLTGHSGEGIEFMEASKPNSFVDAPLYVEYVKKKDEYRIHFVHDKIIAMQRKALKEEARIDAKYVNWRVRNLANGFIYARNNITPPDDVVAQAKKVIKISGLDFGAIDIIWNEKSRKAYVLEVNTAPGLTGETLVDYSRAFEEYLA